MEVEPGAQHSQHWSEAASACIPDESNKQTKMLKEPMMQLQARVLQCLATGQESF